MPRKKRIDKRRPPVDPAVLKYLASGSLADTADDIEFFELLSLTTPEMQKIYIEHKETIDGMSKGKPWIATQLKPENFSNRRK